MTRRYFVPVSVSGFQLVSYALSRGTATTWTRRPAARMPDLRTLHLSFVFPSQDLAVCKDHSLSTKVVLPCFLLAAFLSGSWP